MSLLSRWGHLAAACREPVKCLRCRGLGHTARECRAAGPHSRTRPEHLPPPPPGPPPLDTVKFPELPRLTSSTKLLQPTMVQPGDPALRLEETSAVAASNDAMEKELARLQTCAVVACLCRGRDDVEPESVKKALCSRIGVRQTDIKVVRHRPEDFLIDFKQVPSPPGCGSGTEASSRRQP
jgi:hypothetical protein